MKGAGTELAISLDPEVAHGGGIVWEAATVLSRFLAERGSGEWSGWEELEGEARLRGGVGGAAAAAGDDDHTPGAGQLRVLELGSGTGVCGMLAHNACQRRLPRLRVRTLLTDAHTVELIKANIARNAPLLLGGGANTVGGADATGSATAAAAAAAAAAVPAVAASLPEAAVLDWEELGVPEHCCTGERHRSEGGSESERGGGGGGGSGSCSKEPEAARAWAGSFDLVLGSDITYDEDDGCLDQLLAGLRHLCSAPRPPATDGGAAAGARPATAAAAAGPHRTRVLLAHTHRDAASDGGDDGGSSGTAYSARLLERLRAAGQPTPPLPGNPQVSWTARVVATAKTDPADVWSSEHLVSIIELRACSS